MPSGVHGQDAQVLIISKLLSNDFYDDVSSFVTKMEELTDDNIKCALATDPNLCTQSAKSYNQVLNPIILDMAENVINLYSPILKRLYKLCLRYGALYGQVCKVDLTPITRIKTMIEKLAELTDVLQKVQPPITCPECPPCQPCQPCQQSSNMEFLITIVILVVMIIALSGILIYRRSR